MLAGDASEASEESLRGRPGSGSAGSGSLAGGGSGAGSADSPGSAGRTRARVVSSVARLTYDFGKFFGNIWMARSRL